MHPAQSPGGGDVRKLGMPARCFMTELSAHYQRVVQRSLSESDIVYSLVAFGPYHQALVKLACLGGSSFVGELFVCRRQAIQSAAEYALEFYLAVPGDPSVTESEEEMQPGATADLKGAESACPVRGPLYREGRGRAPPRIGDPKNPSPTPKVMLNTLCTRVASRHVVKGDTVYTTTKGAEGFQATVRSKVLPGSWSHVHWTGKMRTTRYDAEQSAAAAAMASLAQSREIEELIQARRAMKESGAPLPSLVGNRAPASGTSSSPASASLTI